VGVGYSALKATFAKHRSTHTSTVADLSAQSLISLHLLNFFPGDKIVGEEDTTELRQNDALRSKVVQLVNDGFGKGRAEEGSWAEGREFTEDE
jgi:3'(2'), 5'-bisphosphate nucleotidase